MNLIFNPDPILRMKCNTVTEDISDIIPEMFKIMEENNGIGLAAPQVGISKTFFIAKIKDRNFIFINPEIEPCTHRTTSLKEGCLSLPGLEVEVTRPSGITITWTDLDNKNHKANYFGLTARIIQHEIDHLNGKLIIDYLKNPITK